MPAVTALASAREPPGSRSRRRMGADGLLPLRQELKRSLFVIVGVGILSFVGFYALYPVIYWRHS